MNISLFMIVIMGIAVIAMILTHFSNQTGWPE